MEAREGGGERDRGTVLYLIVPSLVCSVLASEMPSLTPPIQTARCNILELGQIPFDGKEKKQSFHISVLLIKKVKNVPRGCE